jgi:hypothetical protein
LSPSWCVGFDGFGGFGGLGTRGRLTTFRLLTACLGKFGHGEGQPPSGSKTEKHELRASQRDAGKHLHEQRNLNPCLLRCREAEAGR